MPSRTHTLVRPRLLAQVRQLRPGQFGVVHGPLGSGRRTLVHQWAVADDLRVRC